MQLQLSTLLQGGKYRIEKVLGQGGFGITYLATQVVLNRKVAIKEFFMKEYCNRDAETSHVTIPSDGSKEFVARFRQKFIKEAQTIAGLNHPHIIRIYDVFEENDTAYYVMEYHDNGSLSELVKQHGALPEAEALRYIREVADALGYIHEHQMNHLDVKPGNVLLDEKGRSVLIDFGLSKRYDESGQQTSTTPVGISHGYAPMEQYKQGGVGTFSPATDIYSLGATLYKLLTGKTPPDASDVFTDGLPALPSSISVAVSNAIAQAMLPNKKKRPQSVAAFLALLDKEPVVTPNEDDDEEDTVLEIDPQPAPTPKPQPKPQPQPAPAPAPQPTPTSSKNKWLVPTLIAVVVALAIIFWPRGGGEELIPQVKDTFVVDSVVVEETVVVEENISLTPAKEIPAKVSTPNVTTLPKTIIATTTETTVRAKSLQDIYDEAMTFYRNKDYTEAIPLLKDAANKGHADAQYNLGYCYDEGLGTSIDDSKAVEWYRKAAEQGHANAQFSLGVNYYIGEGVSRDYSESIKWFRKAAEQGHANAQYNLGHCYELGKGVSQDYSEAVRWCRKAAEQGDILGQRRLGYFYEVGLGVSQDYSEAVNWYSKAAEQGYARAQHDLGLCYYYGTGVSVDKSEALKWLQKAANQGNKNAMKFIDEHTF